MRLLSRLVAGMVLVGMTGAIAENLGDVRLKSGRTLKGVTVLGYSQSSFMAKWENGRGTVAYADLPDELRVRLEQKRPPSPKKPSVAVVVPDGTPPPAPPAKPPTEFVEGKLILGNIDLRAVENLGNYVKYAWKAEIVNGKKETRRVDAEIKLFDKDGFELDHDYAETVYVSPGKRATATGMGMVSNAIWDAAKSFRVKLND